MLNPNRHMAGFPTAEPGARIIDHHSNTIDLDPSKTCTV
jgi:hypothetical protein